MKIGIIGAGMAGLACAERLTEAGHAVKLFDKGRGPGGRMSTRRVATPAGDAAFDHGAQYFTARDPRFRARVARWAAAGLAAPWPAAGSDAWVGTPAMSAPLRRMAGGLDVQWSARVDALDQDDGFWHARGAGIDAAPFDVALVAVPAEQAAPLLEQWDSAMAARAWATPSLPCWTVMAAFPQRLSYQPDILREADIIGWAARNSAKPGRAGPESWVIQATPDWSAAHLEDAAADVSPTLLREFAERLGCALPDPLTVAAHRWRYARAGSTGDTMLWSPETRIGVCGDWLLGPRVECAWLSGDALADVVLGSGRS